MTTDRPEPAGRRRLGLLAAAAILAIGWLAFLGVLAARTANPVTVNRLQLLSSDAVVVAEVERSTVRDAVLRVERTLAGNVEPGSIEVGGVEPGRFTRGETYIVPLRETDQGFVVTPTSPALKGVPLAYPATEDAVRAVDEVLKTATARPYE